MLEQLLTNPFLYSLSLTLLHFLWQGLLVAIVLKSALLIIHKSKSRLRYALSSIAMLANLLLAVATFLFIFPNKSALVTNNAVPIPLTSLVNELTQQNLLMTYQELLPSILAYSLPYIALLWLLAITILASKLLIEIHNVNHLPKHAHLLPSTELLNRFTELAKQINLRKTPKLLISLKIEVPMAIGWLKPVVLLPASMVTGLNSAQLEMLLLHELAHIRRYDYVVNFLQTLVELLFFFHPCVAWVAKQMRNEREYCSDDIAVQHCGDPIAYAHTLADTASLCAQRHTHTIPSMAMAASGGDLKERVLRLVDHHCAPNNNISKWFAAISIVLSITLISSNQLINSDLINNSLPNQWQSHNQQSTAWDNADALESNLLVSNNLNDSSVENPPSLNRVSQSSANTNSIAQQLLNEDKNTEQPTVSFLLPTQDIIIAQNKNTNPLVSDSTDNDNLSVKEQPLQTTTILTTEKATLSSDELATATVKSNSTEQKQPLDIVQSAIPTSDVELIDQQPYNGESIKESFEKISPPSERISRTFKSNATVEDTIAHATEAMQLINQQTEIQSAPVLNALAVNATTDSIAELAFQRTDSSLQNSTMKNPYQQQLLALNNEQYLATPESNNAHANTKNNHQMKELAVWHGAKQLKSVDPVYPSLAKRKGIEIEVKVRFTIDEYGQVKDIKFAQQNRVSYFKSAIRAAIRKWRFLPAKRNEQAIESQMSKIFSFSLRA